MTVEKVKAGAVSIISEVPAMMAFVAGLADTQMLTECKAQAAAVAEYLAQRKDRSVEEYNAAIKVRLKAEHRLGEVLRETVKHGGHNKKQGDVVSPCLDDSLPEEITRKQSSRAQQLAALPWEKLEAVIDEATEQNSRVSQAAVVKAVQREVSDRPAKRPAPGNPASGEWRVDQGNCLQWLASLPEDSVDLVFCSPPYEMARLYLENGEDKGIARNTEEWVSWMAQVVKACLRVCKGLCAFVVEGQTRDYRWTASPALLMADLHRAGICLRKPPIYHRIGIPGSGGPDWLRNDFEFIICATRGGQLPWSDNTAMGHPPKFEPGGDPTHRRVDGTRVNVGYATMEDRKNVGPHRARQRAGRVYEPPERANPGNVITCVAGGGNMGDELCHENEAPFPERLAEFFVRSFCPAGGTVCDPFSGSGTTGKMAVQWGRRYIGCDIRMSQVELSRRRLAHVQQVLPLEA